VESVKLSPKVLTALEDYISFIRRPVEVPSESLGTQIDYFRQRAKTILAKIDTVFITIREDIHPNQPRFEFHAPLSPEELKYEI
jgi:hypothetical protein